MTRRSPGTAAALLAVLGLLGALLAGCSDDGDTSGSGDTARTGADRATDEGAAATPEPVTLPWDEADLPVPPGPPGRVAVRDAAPCDGVWYLVGAVFPDGAESRPAAWRSTDARTWEPVRLAPRGYWPRRHVLSSVTCRGREVVVVGAKEGGAHGNPRVSTWSERPDGVLTDDIAPFSLYGGPEAVNVGSVAAGPEGYLVSGNRVFGAAVWLSRTGRDFELVDHGPGLASTPRLDSFAIDHLHDGRAWTVVGSATTPGRTSPAPMAWTSRDGRRWTRQEIPPTEAFGDLERVVADDAGLLAGGLDGQRFGLWRRTGRTWSSEGTFGSVDPDGRAFRGVAGLVSDGATALAAVSDATEYAVWTGGADDAADWRPVELPVTPSAGGEHVVTLASSPDLVLLLVDDGEQGRLYSLAWPQ